MSQGTRRQSYDEENQSYSIQANIHGNIPEDEQLDLARKLTSYRQLFNTKNTQKEISSKSIKDLQSLEQMSCQETEFQMKILNGNNQNTNHLLVQDACPMSEIHKQVDLVHFLEKQDNNKLLNKDFVEMNHSIILSLDAMKTMQAQEFNSKQEINYRTKESVSTKPQIIRQSIQKSLTKSNTIYDDEYFFEDNEQKHAKKLRYMNPELFHKLRDHNVEWNFAVFFEYLTYHLVFYYLLGPFTIIPFFKKKTVMRNLSFWGNCAQFYIQSVLYFLNAFNMILYFSSDNTHIFTIEIVYMEVVLFLRAYIIACKYATLHPDKIELYDKYVLSGELTANDYYFARWIFQSDVTIYREAYNSFQRGEYDASMFYMSFFVEPNNECLKQINENIQLLEQWHKHTHEQFQPKCIFPNQESVYGYGIVSFIIKNFTKQNPNLPLFVSAVILALFRGFLLLIYRYVSKEENNLEFTTTEIVQMVGIVYNTSFGYFSSFIFLIFFTKDLQMKSYFQKQCILLLSPKKLNIGVKKILPTINFIDPFSLKAWSTLRRVLLDYGKTYYLRLEAFISVYVFVALFSLVALLLWLFDAYQLPTNIGVACGFEAFFILSFLFYILIQGSIINSSFDMSKNIITDYQILFDDIIRLRKFYFEQGQKSSNMIRSRSIQKIKKILQINDNFKDQENSILNYINDIIDGLNDCSKELEQDSINQPFLFFGAKITKVLVQNILVGLATSIIAIVQYYLSIKN